SSFSEMYRSRSLYFSRIETVPSFEPPSTTMYSKSEYDCPRTLSMVCSIVFAALKQTVTILIFISHFQASKLQPVLASCKFGHKLLILIITNLRFDAKVSLVFCASVQFFSTGPG